MKIIISEDEAVNILADKFGVDSKDIELQTERPAKPIYVDLLGILDIIKTANKRDVPRTVLNIQGFLDKNGAMGGTLNVKNFVEDIFELVKK